MAQPPHPTPFRLTRWFGVVALLSIGVIAAVSVWLLSWFVTERMLLREGTLTRDFVQSLVAVEAPLQTYFARGGGAPPHEVEPSFRHVALMPDMLRTNVYNRDRTVLWSSDRQLIGRQFGPNDELDRALTGAVVVESKTDDERRNGKAEYERLAQPDDLFVEIYVPVLDGATGRVVGAIEFYKNPRGLIEILAQLRRYIAIGGVAFGLLLFAALYGLVQRADGVIQAQQRRLVETETFAAIGEMSSVVAHGIRNPLAAMRSSAELIVDSLRSPRRGTKDDAGNADAAHDIVVQADRLGAWVRELLTYTRPAAERPQPVSVAPLIRSCLQELTRAMDRRHVGASATCLENLPAVQAEALVVGQVLRSVLANAVEAVPEGGRIAIRAEVLPGRDLLLITVSDDGPGMTAEQRAAVGRPFFTTKPHGMGMGLALARRVLERSGGWLRIDSEKGRGTVVSIGLRTLAAAPHPHGST